MLSLAIAAGCGNEGIRATDTGAGYPPDPNIAVGPNHVVQTVNGLMRIYRKYPDLGEVLTTISLDTLVGCTGTFDPRTRYDFGSQRWYVQVSEAQYPSGRICLAVSASNDPTASWYVYRFSVGSGVWPDFDMLGYSADKLLITFNRIRFTAGVGDTEGPQLIIVTKSSVLSGGTAVTSGVMAFPFGFAFPAVNYDNEAQGFLTSLAGPSGLWVTAIAGTPGGAYSLTSYPLSLSTPFTVPPEATPAVGTPQKGTIDRFWAPGGTLRDVAYRNNHLWVGGSDGCVPPDDTVTRTCLRLFDILRSGTYPQYSINQDINYGVAGDYLFLPALAIDPDDALIVVFGESSADEYPSIWFTGRRPSDTLGHLRSLGTTGSLVAGQAPYTNGDGVADIFRWGDYFSATLDASDQRYSWLTGEYAGYPAGLWATRVQQLHDTWWQ